MKKSDKSPAQRVYDAFGGPMDVARECKIAISEVYRWDYTKEKKGCDGRVPHVHQETILLAVKRLGLKLKPQDLVKVPA